MIIILYDYIGIWRYNRDGKLARANYCQPQRENGLQLRPAPLFLSDNYGIQAAARRPGPPRRRTISHYEIKRRRPQ